MEISNRTAGKFQKITLYRAFQRKGALVAGLLQRTEERGIVFPVPGLGKSLPFLALAIWAWASRPR